MIRTDSSKLSRLWLLILLVQLAPFSGKSQDRWNGYLEVQAIGTSDSTVPFWMRSNTFGSIPLSGISGSLIGGLYRSYDSTKRHGFDWGLGLEGRANLGERSRLDLIEGYLKMHYHFLEFRAGRSRQVTGLMDTLLSSGSFSVSGNTLGIPKLELAVTDFDRLTLFNHLLSFKGNFAHGWVEDRYWQRDNPEKIPYYFHQKSLYVRIGRPEARAKWYAGLNHQALWTADNRFLGADLSLSQVYWKMLTGQNIRNTKIGNHVGSYDVGFSYEWPQTTLMLYRQNFYDAGGAFHTANLLDGLNGISVTNTRQDNRSIYWRRFLFEVLYSINQAGERWNRITEAGDENYYNNGGQSWYYKDWGLGTPFFTPAHAARPGFASHPLNYFINNRVLAFHGGMQVRIGPWETAAKLSFSHNRGTFATSVEGQTQGTEVDPPNHGIFNSTNQFSGLIRAGRPLKNGFELGFEIGADYGGLLPNSLGGMIRVRKNFQR